MGVELMSRESHSSWAKRLAVVALLMSVPLSGQTPARSPARATHVLETFDYRGVTLDDGMPRRMFDEVRDFYLRIPNDDLLKGYRQRAGLAAPGVELGGWYSNDNGNILGQVISGLARMYRATGDPRCLAKVNALVSEWGRCLGVDGYPFASLHL